MESNQRSFVSLFFVNLLSSLQSRKIFFDSSGDSVSILIKRFELRDHDLWIFDENLFQAEFYFEILLEFH